MAGETTIILLDFDAEKSVTVTGAGKILVRPVVKLTVRQGAALPQAESGEQVLVDAANTGQEVEMAVGDRLVVTLESNPTTGFKWELAEGTDQTVLELVESRYQPGPGASQTPPVTGAGGEEVWTFQALKQGETAISLEYSQPWAGGLKADRTFNLTVEVNWMAAGQDMPAGLEGKREADGWNIGLSLCIWTPLSGLGCGRLIW